MPGASRCRAKVQGILLPGSPGGRWNPLLLPGGVQPRFMNDGLHDSNVATVSVTIMPVNDNVPVANNDAVTVDAGATATITVLGNDTDADLPADSLTVIKMSDPAHGTLTLNADGTFTYVNDSSAELSDSFTYKVNDGLHDSNVATVSITITPVAVV